METEFKAKTKVLPTYSIDIIIIIIKRKRFL